LDCSDDPNVVPINKLDEVNLQFEFGGGGEGARRAAGDESHAVIGSLYWVHPNYLLEFPVKECEDHTKPSSALAISLGANSSPV
jgi:hypothetical protein